MIRKLPKEWFGDGTVENGEVIPLLDEVLRHAFAGRFACTDWPNAKFDDSTRERDFSGSKQLHIGKACKAACPKKSGEGSDKYQERCGKQCGGCVTQVLSHDYYIGRYGFQDECGRQGFNIHAGKNGKKGVGGYFFKWVNRVVPKAIIKFVLRPQQGYQRITNSYWHPVDLLQKVCAANTLVAPAQGRSPSQTFVALPKHYGVEGSEQGDGPNEPVDGKHAKANRARAKANRAALARPWPETLTIYPVRAGKPYLWNNPKEGALFHAPFAWHEDPESRLVQWVTCLDQQYNKFQGLRYNEKSNVFEKLKGGTPPACRKNGKPDGKPDWPECRKACERKKTTRGDPIVPNSPKGCTSQIKVKLVRCSSCCCKSGVATQDITHSLLYGEQKDCGIWFAAQDAIVRAVATFWRGGMIVTFYRRCYKD